MQSTSLTVSQSRQITWPRWTDAFELSKSYLDLTVEILCDLCDGTPGDCRCSGTDTNNWYAEEARRILQTIWPNGPLEMIALFNEYAEYKRLEDKQKVRDPVSSAFYKLAEHAAFWTFVKNVVREHLDVGYASQAKPGQYRVGDKVGNLVVNYLSPGTGMPGFECGECSGALGAPPQQETNMNTQIVNPFGPLDDVSFGGEMGAEQPAQPSNTGLYVAAGLGVLLIGGLIAADMYRTKKGIRPVYMAPPMAPMGVYY